MTDEIPPKTLLLRTEATARHYEEVKKVMPKGAMCRLCADSETLEEYTHWRRMPNAFPYDRYCTRSDLLVTRRHTDERGLTGEERAELIELKQYKLSDLYDHVLETLPRQQSIPHHYHFHLLTWKRPA